MVCAMAGAGSVASLWQQAGRAGRREQPSVSIYIGFDGPLDQFFMHQPENLFSRSIETAQVQPIVTYFCSTKSASVWLTKVTSDIAAKGSHADMPCLHQAYINQLCCQAGLTEPQIAAFTFHSVAAWSRSMQHVPWSVTNACRRL